jgi:outer membrane protein assembly factor BamB
VTVTMYFRTAFSASALVALAGSAGCGDSTGVGGRDMRALWASPVVSAGQEWIDGTPAADQGHVFIQEANQLVGIDAGTGARLWSRQIRAAPAPPPTTLLAADGVLYVSETDSVMAVDGATGRTIWSMHPDSQAVAVPAVDATGLYTGQRGIAAVYALERSNGILRWKQNVVPGNQFGAFIHGVAVSGDTVYAAVEVWLDLNGVSSKGVLVALDRMSGMELWRYETPGTKDFFLGAPIVTSTKVIVNDAYAGPLIAVDKRTHAEVWRSDAGGSSRAVVIGSMVFTAGHDTKVRAIDLETGTVKWQASSGSSAFGLGACGNSVFVSAFHLRRFDATTGTLTGEANRDTYDDFFSNVASDGTRAYAVAGRGTFAFSC